MELGRAKGDRQRGQIYLQTHFVFRRESECFNAQTCWYFFKKLERISTRTGRRVVVITDNAKYHHATFHRDWRAARVGRFEFDFLPPYSPDLNPIERVWKLVRRLRLHNRYFAASMRLPKPSRISSGTGGTATIPCADYAQLLRTLSRWAKPGVSCWVEVPAG